MMHDEQLTSTSDEICDSTLEANKKAVLDFIEKAVNQGDIDAASVHFGEKYIQHNPNIADGVEGFRAYLQQLRHAFPLVRGEVKRIFADGDFVIVHMHAKREPEEAGPAIVDFFRLTAGKIVEHWEVRQPVAESTLHTNSMLD
jgi:predicted SnoaL-like aldol condensation-catalyzing enzyme